MGELPRTIRVIPEEAASCRAWMAARQAALAAPIVLVGRERTRRDSLPVVSEAKRLPVDGTEKGPFVSELVELEGKRRVGVGAMTVFGVFGLMRGEASFCCCYLSLRRSLCSLR